ncbi:hypothetical protein SNEBB_005145 [Seison nebaliae]|nr:hypothetical protein SNEBB_005145 [Seison nebaliae]
MESSNFLLFMSESQRGNLTTIHGLMTRRRKKNPFIFSIGFTGKIRKDPSDAANAASYDEIDRKEEKIIEVFYDSRVLVPNGTIKGKPSTVVPGTEEANNDRILPNLASLHVSCLVTKKDRSVNEKLQQDRMLQWLEGKLYSKLNNDPFLSNQEANQWTRLKKGIEAINYESYYEIENSIII